MLSKKNLILGATLRLSLGNGQLYCTYMYMYLSVCIKDLFKNITLARAYTCANVTVLTWHSLNKYSLLNVRFNDQVSLTYVSDIFHFYQTFRMNNNNMWWILLVLPIMGFVIGVFFFCKWRYTVRRRTGMY